MWSIALIKPKPDTHGANYHVFHLSKTDPNFSSMECLIFVRQTDIYTLGCVRRKSSDSSAPEVLH